MELFNLNKKNADFIKIKVEKLVDWNEPNGDGCVVSDKITKEGFKVGYMYREKPEEGRPDSGWRFLAGNEDEEYMNDLQVEYFRQKLLAWKKSLLNQSQDTLEDLRQGGLNQPDDIDRASMETDKALDLRTKDRARKLISKINDALKRIEDGTYGYCEETGEPIGLERLEARPVATLSIEAQERHERMEKTYDDEA